MKNITASKIAKFLISLIIPYCCQQEEFEKLTYKVDGKLHHIDKDQLPDILWYIDILFYTYIYSVAFTWFDQTIPYQTWGLLATYVTVFYTSVFVSRIFAKKYKLLKYKNR